jgi:hypothetical protein
VRKPFLIGALCLVMGHSVSAQDFAAAQASNTEALTALLSALQAKDAARIRQIDALIDYSKGYTNNTFISAENMIELLSVCTANDISTASRMRDFLTLDYSCPDRVPEGTCSTGDLRVMIFQDGRSSLGLIEKQRLIPECAPPAPPLPRRQGTS